MSIYPARPTPLIQLMYTTIVFADPSTRALAVLQTPCKYGCRTKFSISDILRLRATYDANPHKTAWVITKMMENKTRVDGKRQFLLDGNMVRLN